MNFPQSAMDFVDYRIGMFFGFIILIVASIETISGEAVQRFGSLIERRVDPKRFWQNVVVHYFVGLVFVVYCLVQRIGSPR